MVKKSFHKVIESDDMGGGPLVTANTIDLGSSWEYPSILKSRPSPLPG